jgi:ParB family chromosome partitioning protein
MALGKNLGNLLGDYFGEYSEGDSLLSETKNFRQINVQDTSQTAVFGDSLIQSIPVDKITLNPYQTRTQFDFEKIQALAESIKTTGLLNPIIVSKRGENYILLAGERRLRAVKLLGQTEILAIVKPDEQLTEADKVLISATENLQREDLTPIELACTYKSLLTVLQIDEKELAERLGVTAQYIKNYLRLLTLSREVQKALLERKIGEGHARHLVGLPEEQQEMALKIILERDLSVREIIELVKKMQQNSWPNVTQLQKPEVIPNLEPDIIQTIDTLKQRLPNAKIKFSGNERKGKLTISWSIK